MGLVLTRLSEFRVELLRASGLLGCGLRLQSREWVRIQLSALRGAGPCFIGSMLAAAVDD